MGSAPDSTRGTADRGTSVLPERERNVRRGEVRTIVPDQTFNVVGFDIGRANLDKPGIKEQLEPVVQRLHLLTGQYPRHPVVRITGHASESRLPGKGPEEYASRRAAALKTYLVLRGVPEAWIQTDTSREASVRSLSAGAVSDAKALARSATIEIGMSEDRHEVAARYGDTAFIEGKTRQWWSPVFPPELPAFPSPSVELLKRLAGAGLLAAGAAAVLPELPGLVTLAVALAVARHIWGPKSFPDRVAKYMGEKITELDPQHHIFPQKLLPQFNDLGINIHEYTKRIPLALHKLLHPEWELLWQVFFEQSGGTATQDAVWRFANELMKRWGIDKLPFEVWKRTSIPR